jgi:hypothetical protein
VRQILGLVAVLAIASCEKPSEAPSSTAPGIGAEPASTSVPIDADPIALRFATATAATTCSTVIDAKGTMVVEGGTHNLAATAKSRLSLVAAPPSELGLQLRELHLRIDIDDQTLSAFDIDAQGMHTRTGGTVSSKLVADDAGARRAVDLLLGAPRVFLTLDERAQVTKRRTDVPTAFAAFAEQIDGSPSWLLTMPVLPGDAKVGDCWTGLRPLAVSSTVKPTPEVELRFCLASINDMHAVITSNGSTQGRYAIVRGTEGELRWSLEGEATVTREGGRLVAARLRGSMDSRGHAELEASSMTFTVDSKCEAAVETAP